MGEDEKMLHEHDKLLKEDIIPRIGALEQGQMTLEQGQIALKQQQEAANLQLDAFKLKLSSFELSQQEIKNTVVEYGTAQKEQTGQLLKHVLDMNKTQQKTDEKLTMKRLNTKEKVLLSVLGGSGLVAGLISLAVTIWG
jgi:Holliday junction resolvasome RuvABC endonuclease subunit